MPASRNPEEAKAARERYAEQMQEAEQQFNKEVKEQKEAPVEIEKLLKELESDPTFRQRISSMMSRSDISDTEKLNQLKYLKEQIKKARESSTGASGFTTVDYCVRLDGLNAGGGPEQRVLIENMDWFARSNKKDYPLFYRDKSDSYGALVNQLVGKNAIKDFLRLKGYEQALLVPYVKLYKVFDKGKIQIPFLISDHITEQEISSMTTSGEERGNGVGITKLSWDYKGTQPADSDKYITFKMSMFFQNLNDFFDVRTTKQGPISFADLTWYNYATTKGHVSTTRCKDEKEAPVGNPYSIKAVIGWSAVDSVMSPVIGDSKKKEAIEKAQISFILNPVLHEFEFTASGNVEASFDFIARLDMFTISRDADLFLMKQLSDAVSALQTAENEHIKVKCGGDPKKKKSEEEKKNLEEKEKAVQSLKEKLSTEAESQIMARLMRCAKEQRMLFKELGISDDTKATIRGANMLAKDVGEGAVYSFKYFYVGDLIQTVLQIVHDNSPGFISEDSNQFIVGNFSMRKNKEVMSIADIPISVAFFNSWYVKNFVKQGRKSLPLGLFLRNMVAGLLTDATIKALRGSRTPTSMKLEKKRFGITILSGNKGAYSSAGRSNMADFNSDHTSSDKDGQKDVSVNYYVIYVTDFNYSQYVNQERDEARGIYHLTYGSESGIVRRMKFKNKSVAGMREARIMEISEGRYARGKLLDIYDAEVEMLGCPFFVNGMQIYLNSSPIFGFLGQSHKNPMATALGLISYFTIVSVKSDLDLVRSNFTTTLSCMNQAPALPQVDGENGEEGEYDEGPPPSPPIEASFVSKEEEEGARLSSDPSYKPGSASTGQSMPPGIESQSLGVPKSCPKVKTGEGTQVPQGAAGVVGGVVVPKIRGR